MQHGCTYIDAFTDASLLLAYAASLSLYRGNLHQHVCSVMMNPTPRPPIPSPQSTRSAEEASELASEQERERGRDSVLLSLLLSLSSLLLLSLSPSLSGTEGIA